MLRALLIAFVAGLAGYLTWDRIEAHRLAAGVAAIAARGEPIDLSSFERTPSTAQEQEAAQLYAEGAARAREIIQQDGILPRVDVDAVIAHVEVADIESRFRRDGPAMQLLDRATVLPFAGFGDALDGPEWASTQGLQALAALAALRSDLLAYHGDGDGAAASLAASVRVQQTMTDAFSKRTNVLRQFGSLRILLRHAAPSPLALESLQRVFAETPDEDGMVRGLLLRRARLIEMQSDGINPGGVPSVLAFLFHPFLVHNLRVQIEEFPEVMAAARLPWPDKIGALSAIGEAAANRDGRSSFRRQVFGPPFNLAVLSPEASPMFAGTWLAVRRLAVTTLAIERYRRAHDGDPPRNLAPLVPAYLPALPVDPFTGKSLVYTPSASDYLLYSVDVNRTDDGGQIYGLGSLNPLPYPRLRDLGIRVPRTPQRGAL